jgi:hypothetical protein
LSRARSFPSGTGQARNIGLWKVSFSSGRYPLFFSCDRMPIWKTGVATSHATAVISALLLCVSCGPPEQGYWTKQDISQALMDEQYAADSQHCERFAAQNDGRESDKGRTKRYTKCMSARGGLNPEVNQSITRKENSHHKPANRPPDPSYQSIEQRLVKDRECRQQAAATLSSPYAVYVNCMQEKRWSSPPAIGAIAELSAENEQPDPTKGHTQEDIRLQSAARNGGDENPTSRSPIGNTFTADSADNETPDPNKSHAQEEIALQSATGKIRDENPKMASARGNMFPAASAENEKPEPTDALERIGLVVQSTARIIGNGISKIGSAIGHPLEAVGRGLQSAFRNIGDGVSKIGSRFGNIFKQLGGNDTRDTEKEKASNTRVAPPPKDAK